MSEEAYNRIHGDDYGHFTFTTEQGRDAFIRRCEKYNADYHLENHHLDGEWDTATVKVASEDLRPLRYLIGTGA